MSPQKNMHELLVPNLRWYENTNCLPFTLNTAESQLQGDRMDVLREYQALGQSLAGSPVTKSSLEFYE